MTRRSKMDILQAMKEFLDESDFKDLNKSFFKSDFRSKGIDPSTAEEFLRIVEFCQTQFPPIKIITTGKRVLIKLDKSQILSGTPLKQELLDRVQNRVSVVVDQKENRLFYSLPPPLLIKFRCTDCEIESLYPEHCNEPMEYESDENILRCEICGLTQPLPLHHGKTMKIKVEKRKKKDV